MIKFKFYYWHNQLAEKEKRRKKKTMKCNRLFALMLLISMLAATFAMVPSAFAGDWERDRLELWGPRVDRLRFNYYAGPDAEFTALEGKDIDITDWPLTRSWVDKWSDPPYTDYIEQDWSGGERGMFNLDSNQNETMPDGSYNPIGDPTIVTMTITSSGVPDEGETYTASRGYHFLHATAHLVKRVEFISTVLLGLGEPVYAWMPTFYGPNVNPTVDQHPYSPTEAAEILTKAGFVDTDADTWRNDPVTGNNLNIDLVYRFQHTPGRKELGEWVALELELIDVDVTLDPKDGAGAFAKVMVSKDFHFYTGGWSLGTVPDHMYALFHSDFYWDSGMFCLNYGNHHDPLHDALSELVYYAPDATTAVTANWDCQETWVDPEHMGSSLSIWSAMAPKACSIFYVGAGEHYGKVWKSLINEDGFGTNSYLTFVSMHPEGVDIGGTIEYGSYVSKIPGALNPFYASWYPDYEVLNKVYDSLCVFDPYDPTNLDKYLPWLATAWEVETWANPDNPDFPTSTKLTFHLDTNIRWHDGTPFTSADVKYTIDYGRDPGNEVDWYPSVADVHHVEAPDDYTIIVYENVLSCWALNWIGIGFPVAPKHIWEAIEADPEIDIRGFSPDPHIIGTGPFMVGLGHSIDPLDADYYVPEAYCILDANLDFFRYCPVQPVPFELSKACAGGGQGVSSTSVVIRNYDIQDYTIDVSLNYGTQIQLKTGVFIPSHGEVTVIFDPWDPTGLPQGAYNISVQQTPLSRSFVKYAPPHKWGAAIGSIFIIDCNDDGNLDLIDATMMVGHFASYNVNCDFNSNGRADGMDATMMVVAYR